MKPQYAAKSKPVKGTVALSRQDEPPNGPWVAVAEFASQVEADRYLAVVVAHAELVAALEGAKAFIEGLKVPQDIANAAEQVRQGMHRLRGIDAALKLARGEG
jgi:hypothetical protein